MTQWTHQQEQELNQLKKNPIKMKDTALATAANQMSKALTDNVKLLLREEASHLLLALQERQGQPETPNQDSNDQEDLLREAAASRRAI